MLAEISLSLAAILLYRKTNLKAFVFISVSTLLGIFTKFAAFFLAISLAYLCYEVILASAYKPLNKAEE